MGASCVCKRLVGGGGLRAAAFGLRLGWVAVGPQFSVLRKMLAEAEVEPQVIWSAPGFGFGCWNPEADAGRCIGDSPKPDSRCPKPALQHAETSQQEMGFAEPGALTAAEIAGHGASLVENFLRPLAGFGGASLRLQEERVVVVGF